MYSWAQRSDTQVLDEPLYAHYLQYTGLARPYGDLVLDAQPSDGNAVLESLSAPRSSQVLFVKHMAKHKVGLGDEALLKGRHMILIRDPYSVIKSFGEVLQPTLTESCYPALCEIFSALRTRGSPPIVVMSEQLGANPEGMLRAMCVAMELPFEEAMLKWPAGPKPFDGPWANWWYSTTHRSTQFEAVSSSRGAAMSSDLHDLLEECRPFYNLLKRHALKPLNLLGEPSRPMAAPDGGEQLRGVGKESGSIGATHTYKPDTRNGDILIGIRNGVTMQFEVVCRPEAKVSVLDSGFVLGDGVWEGIRLHRGVLLYADQHIDRLFDGSKTIDMDLGRRLPLLHSSYP